MKHAFFEGLKAPLHISHRGGAALYPENTMLAFRSAVELHGTDMLELDIHSSRDGVVVVAHDDTLERCTNGTGPLAALTHAELTKLDAGRGEVIPRFEDVLIAFPALRINVELKTMAALEPFVALMKRMPFTAAPVCRQRTR